MKTPAQIAAEYKAARLEQSRRALSSEHGMAASRAWAMRKLREEAEKKLAGWKAPAPPVEQINDDFDGTIMGGPTQGQALERYIPLGQSRTRQVRKGPPGAPKPPSGAQWTRLSLELSDGAPGRTAQLPSRETVLAWVRFANAYDPGPYSSLHFSIALDLIIRGRNEFGTVQELIDFSSGIDLPNPDGSIRIRRFKGVKK